MPIVTSSASTFADAVVPASFTTTGLTLVRLQKLAHRIMRITEILPLVHPAQQIGAQVMIGLGDFDRLDLNCRKVSFQVVDVAPLITGVTLLGMKVMLGFLKPQSWIGRLLDWALSYVAATTRSKLYFNPLTL